MMTLSQLQSFFGWGALLNYAVMIVGFLAWVLAGDALFRLHARWFDLDRRTCHAAAYLILGFYKITTWVFFVVPWIALCILGRQGGTP
jgi:hypothetical protein